MNIALDNLILKCEVGSRVHGLSIGSDDKDEMGVCIEPPEYIIGLKKFEQYVYRTAEERQGHNPSSDQRRAGRTPRSEPGDLDLVVYSLRKYCRLAVAGNPSLLVLLYATPIVGTVIGNKLQSLAPAFASKSAGRKFLGYLRAQKQRLLGERGQMRVTRTELIEKYGYDTKYAMQAVRLGFQGIEYLIKGQIDLPMSGSERELCLDIRRGNQSFEAVIATIKNLEAYLEYEIDVSRLPDQADHNTINQFLVQAYQECWSYKNEA